MKLIYCNKCGDVLSLRKESRTCFCGDSGGKYVDSLQAEIWGSAVPLGFLNGDFVEALANRPAGGLGVTFTAFVIPHSSLTVAVKTNENRRAYEQMLLDEVTDLTLKDLFWSYIPDDAPAVDLVSFIDKNGGYIAYLTKVKGYKDEPDHFVLWSEPKRYSNNYRDNVTVGRVLKDLCEHLDQWDGQLVNLLLEVE